MLYAGRQSQSPPAFLANNAHLSSPSPLEPFSPPLEPLLRPQSMMPTHHLQKWTVRSTNNRKTVPALPRNKPQSRNPQPAPAGRQSQSPPLFQSPPAFLASNAHLSSPSPLEPLEPLRRNKSPEPPAFLQV